MDSTRDPLEPYRRKRDFHHTAEPQGTPAPTEHAPAGEPPVFVVQKHRASRLHYDFRLEVGGVLKSWAIPKGPSLDPKDKRLAVPTEDHPLEYARFEGNIPEKQYGAGTVIVWDIGGYYNLKRGSEGEIPLEQCLADGRVEIRLEGQKLRGGFALIRTGRPEDQRWLLIKMKDAEARSPDDSLARADKSAISGKSLEEVESGSQ